jgi:hypothetical protein
MPRGAARIVVEVRRVAVARGYTEFPGVAPTDFVWVVRLLPLVIAGKRKPD